MSKITDGFTRLKQYDHRGFGIYRERDVLDLLTHARALEAMLRKVEWEGFDYGECLHGPDFCPSCNNSKWAGHSPDCALAKLLEE